MSKFKTVMNEKVKQLWEKATESGWPRPGKFTAGEYDYLMERFCPLKVGDRVMLKHRPDPMPSGWAGSAHFLVRGAIATISSAECTTTGFAFDVVFDDESWIKEDFVSNVKEVVPVEPDLRNSFKFGENILVKV